MIYACRRLNYKLLLVWSLTMRNGNFMFCCNVDLLDKVEPGDKQTREAFESFKNKFVQQNCHRDVEIRLANVNKQKVLYEDDSLCCCQSELTWKYLHTLHVRSPFFNPNRVYSNTYRQNIEEAVNITLIIFTFSFLLAIVKKALNCQCAFELEKYQLYKAFPFPPNLFSDF